MIFSNHGEMHFHWLMKHKVGKNDNKLYSKFPSYEQPEEIEVDDFIK